MMPASLGGPGPRRMTRRTFSESPLLVFYEVTQACDLVCKHCRACAQAKPHPSELTTEESIQLIDQFADWLNECMERGAKLVDIAPEYNCPATKSNYWISVRPGLSDLVVLLGVTKIMLDNNWYKPDFCRRFTDFPLLVRTDTLRRLQSQDIVADYQPKDITGGPSSTAAKSR